MIPVEQFTFAIDIKDECVGDNNYASSMSDWSNNQIYIREQRPCLVIMMGLQGSGKTTFCQSQYSTFEHISLDLQKSRRNEGLKLQRCIDEHLDCVIDNTNPTKGDRARYIIPGKNGGFRIIGYFMRSKLSECLERNERRERQIPKKGILATFNKIELPSLKEGFDELNFVSIENREFKISKWIEDEI